MQFLKSILLCIISLFSTCDVYADHIHALIAADTLTNIRYSSYHDIANIKKALDTISTQIQVPLHLQEITGLNLSLENIDQWLYTTQSTSSDIVVFYFTGHGLRSKKSTTIWPALYFVPSGKLIDMTSIVNKIKQVPARLYVIISDCCNNVHKRARIMFPKGPISKDFKEDLSRRGYAQLFLETKGIIIASGAVPGELAWASDRGGIFTNSLLESLRHEVFNKPQPKWERIFERSGAICKSLQKPQYSLSIRRS